MPFRRVPESIGYNWILQNRELVLNNPVRRVDGHCVFLRLESSKRTKKNLKYLREWVEKESTYQAVAVSAFPKPDEFTSLMKEESRTIDLYHCHGSISHGSGRSILSEGYQIKGVGRTLAASVHDFYKDICGTQGIHEAFREVYYTEALDELLYSGTFKFDFISIPRDRSSQVIPLQSDLLGGDDLRCLLGRRGSPIRLTHLEYLAGRLLRFGKRDRSNLWQKHLCPITEAIGISGNLTEKNSFARFVGRMLTRACLLTIESRFYGLKLPYWGDNSDIFSRVFDCADTTCTFPALNSLSQLPSPGNESPVDFFGSIGLGLSLPVFDHALFPIKNVLSALQIISQGADVEVKNLEGLVTWPALESLYRRCLRVVIRKFLSQIRFGEASSVLSPEKAILAEQEIIKHLPLARGEERIPHLGDNFNLLEYLATFVSEKNFQKWQLGPAARIERIQSQVNLDRLYRQVTLEFVEPFLKGATQLPLYGLEDVFASGGMTKDGDSTTFQEVAA